MFPQNCNSPPKFPQNMFVSTHLNSKFIYSLKFTQNLSLHSILLNINCTTLFKLYHSIKILYFIQMYHSKRCVLIFQIYYIPQNVSYYLKYITLPKLYITTQNMSYYSKLYFTDQKISHYSKMYPLLKMSHTASKYITLL